jgi:hypothetical protein
MWKVKLKNGKTVRVSDNKLSKLQIGDVVHSVAQPIAKAIDKVAGTNIQGCAGCKRRRARLNGRLDIDTLVNDADTYSKPGSA